MENYKELGNKYLKINKKRSFITVLGCFIVAAGLFMLLNTLVCWVEKCRLDARKDDDYEIVILTEDKDIIEKIVNEKFVTSAYLGKVYSWVYEDDPNSVYSNVLHINVREKLLINYYSKYIAKTYGVETEMNELLAWTYCQDNEGIGYIMLLFGLFISLILAIIGVGVLRNNISISAMERVKDYGNLRCIGATKRQVKAIVYRESTVLETVGIVAGVFVGFLLSIPVCRSDKMQYPVGFHIIPVILLMIAFYGDMYFAVDDGLKKVLAVSPSEAVRGNYRIKAKGIKRRRSGIWSLIFGVEGDYAYKNIKRNNGSYIKTVSALVFGMVIVIVVCGWLGVFYKFYDHINTMYGYYQQYIECDTDRVSSYEEQRADLYSPEVLKKITSAKGIEDPKFIYQSTLYPAEDCFMLNNLNEDYYMDTYEAHEYYIYADVYNYKKRADWLKDNPDAKEEDYPWAEALESKARKKEERKKYRALEKGLVDYASNEPYDEERKNYKIDFSQLGILKATQIDICGYDQEDYSRYKANLVEGTTELSENGVLLVNKGHLVPQSADEEEVLIIDKEEFTFTDLKVGDEITYVDPVELYDLVQEERKNAAAYDKLMQEESDKWEKVHQGEKDEEGNPLHNPYDDYDSIEGNARKEAWIINSAREKLIDEGECRTLIIEGIIEDDPNKQTGMPELIVPLDRFYDITGKTESDYNGMKFHIGNIFSRDLGKDEFTEAINERQTNYYEGMEEDREAGFFVYESYTSPFLETMVNLVNGIKTALAIVFAIVVIISISLLNTMNVSIGSLQMRRNEFAQLRSIGMTKRSLIKVVLLEGGIVWIVATVLGILVGIGIEVVFYIKLMRLLINSDMYICWPAIILTAILSLLVLCGSNLIFFKQMKLNVAESLIRSGE